MEREQCALRDQQVRVHSVRTDLELNLPPSLHLPDGEEIPYGSSTRLHIRDAEQVSAFYPYTGVHTAPHHTIGCTTYSRRCTIVPAFTCVLHMRVRTVGS